LDIPGLHFVVLIVVEQRELGSSNVTWQWDSKAQSAKGGVGDFAVVLWVGLAVNAIISEPQVAVSKMVVRPLWLLSTVVSTFTSFSLDATATWL
jgi:hypothetical protein